MYSKVVLSRADAVALGAVVLLAALLAPTVFAQAEGRSRELANRTTCATNLKGLGTAVNVYAAENNDEFPILPAPASATAYDVAFKAEAGGSQEATLKGLYGQPSSNPLGALWVMVLRGDVGPKNFLCRSDPFANVPAALTMPGAFGSVGGYFGNFQYDTNISYSVIYPWTVDKDKKVVTYQAWSATIESSLPIMSDMAPYLGKKAKAEEAATRPADSKPDAPMDEDWAVKKANTQNHLFQGQNVLFADAHCDFDRSPEAGESPRAGANSDSIWGIHKSEEKEPQDVTEVVIEAGALPHPPMGSTGNYDVVMVPTRDAKGNLK